MKRQSLLFALVLLLQSCGSEEYTGFSASYSISGTSDPSDSGPVNLHYEASTGAMTFYDDSYESSAKPVATSEANLSDAIRIQVNNALVKLSKTSIAKVYKSNPGASSTDGIPATLTLYSGQSKRKEIAIDTSNDADVPDPLLYLYNVSPERGLQ